MLLPVQTTNANIIATTNTVFGTLFIPTDVPSHSSDIFSGKSIACNYLRLVFSFFFVSAFVRPAGRSVGDSMVARVKSFCIRALGLGMT